MWTVGHIQRENQGHFINFQSLCASPQLMRRVAEQLFASFMCGLRVPLERGEMEAHVRN